MAEAADLEVAIAQIPARQAWADPEAVAANANVIADLYSDLADRVDLVVFPELALTGYIPLKGYDQRRKRILAEAARQAATIELDRLVGATKGRRAALVVGLMEPASMRDEFHNSVVLAEGGQLTAVYRKIHLPVEENHYFLPGDQVVVANTKVGRVALLICYDLLFPEVSRIASLAGADLLVVVSNWLDIAHLRKLGEVLPVARALEGHAHVVFVNGVGELEARGRSWSLYGGSRLVTARGEVVAIAGAGEEVLVGRLPGADLDGASDVFPVMRDRRPEVYRRLVEGPASFALLGDPES
ncbi:MAG: carbon-nitrogen hydrolase family protein [Acidimicrobiia bacterium]